MVTGLKVATGEREPLCSPLTTLNKKWSCQYSTHSW